MLLTAVVLCSIGRARQWLEAVSAQPVLVFVIRLARFGLGLGEMVEVLATALLLLELRHAVLLLLPLLALLCLDARWCLTAAAKDDAMKDRGNGAIPVRPE